MDEHVKLRSVARRCFSRSANSFENLLKADILNYDEAKACYILTRKYYENLTVLDDQIKNIILNTTDWEEKVLDKECEEVGKYEARWTSLETIYESKIAFVKIESPATVTTSERKFKLPLLELKKFNGNIRNWLTFWGSFEKIDNDCNIDDVDKLQYLSQAMEAGTDVKSFVDSFPLSRRSYAQCIKDLKMRYAKDELLIQVYVRELLSLILNREESQEVSELYDKLNGQLRALEILGVTKDKFAAFLLPMVESALPNETLRAWERARPAKTDDILGSLLSFLQKEVESEQRIHMAKTTFTPAVYSAGKKESTATCLAVNVKEQKQLKCIWCDKGHANTECYKLANLSISDRREYLKKKKACALCLKIGHHAKVCKIYVKCYVCGQRHSPVLCPGVASSAETKVSVKPTKNDTEPTLQNLSQNNVKATSSMTTLLQTVAVKILQGDKMTTVRALFDSGSQRSYIKKEVAKKLGLPAAGTEELSHSLFGGVSVSFKKYKLYNLTVQSLDSTFKFDMSALEQSCICSNVPKVDESHVNLTRLLNKHKIRLTDNESADLGLLIGADYAGLLLTNDFIQLENGLTAIKTTLGWTLQGRMSMVNSNVVTSLFCSQNISNYWDLEMLSINDPIQVQSKLQKEEQVMTNFEENVLVNTAGRYEVYLPWKTEHDDLLSNRELSTRRLETTTKKLRSCGKLNDYNNVFCEWEELGFIEEVPEAEIAMNKAHYLPHRAVLKEASLTTKLRPVFDASAKDRNGKSLNSCLDKGINFLDKIPKLLTGFRKGCIGITADIAKAFLQISVTPKDRNFLRFLWWKDESFDKIKVYRHCRVVFGLTSSPFLLSATISHHLNHITDRKNTADILAKSFYVDNIVTSLDTATQTLEFIKEAREIMNDGKFNLRQWATSPLNINETGNAVLSVLGLQWDTVTDELCCNLSAFPSLKEIGKVTKRNLLSLTQKIFDPIGFTCPVTMVPRLMLQQLWSRKTTWDEEISSDVLSQFQNWYESLDCLNNCRLPRRVSAERLQDCATSLHMFCDGSKVGYAACVFLRTEYKGNVTVRLISAKSRISPPEKVTIPRLELLAALIGSRLLMEARKNLELYNCDEFCWCDSGVALCWIKRELPWNTYVGNRVKEIRQNTNTNNWQHIPGTENWADLASRGCNARQLLETRWWEGPPWLLQRPELWPRSALEVDEKIANNELRKSVCANVCCEESMTCRLSGYFSKYTKIVRMVGWILRFIHNLRYKNNRSKGELTFEECDEAEKTIIRLIQEENREYIQKQYGKSTQIYCDGDALIKVKTKLLLTDFPEGMKKPMVVPAKNLIIRRMVEQRHVQLLHAGTNTMITDLRKRYWILGIRLLVKSVIDKCIVCKRHRSRPMQTPTAPLPVERVQLAAPFEVTGVDLAGPVYLRDGEKCWIVLYTCAVYRAVHLELTRSLSTEAFLRTFRRFIARRGRPSMMLSDNGSNFLGTKNLLHDIDWDEVQRQSTIQRIKWKLNVPTAAWWGGFFERLIKVMKNLLRRVLGTSSVSYDEMETLLCDCETVINDRPLTYVEDDSANSLEPIKPSCFLQTLPQSDVTDLDQIDTKSLNKRLRYLQKLRQDFRERFKNEYLTTLVQRGNNRHNKVNIGDLVLVEEEGKRIKWPLGLVVEIFTGKDGISRAAKVKTSSGYLSRPLQRLYRLEISSSEVEGQQDKDKQDPIGEKFRIVINPSSTQVNKAEVQESATDEAATLRTSRTSRVIRMPSRITREGTGCGELGEKDWQVGLVAATF